MNRIFIRPAPGVLVRDPVTKVKIPAEGKEVDESSFWTRRIGVGDVVLVAPEAAPTEEKEMPEPRAKRKTDK